MAKAAVTQVLLDLASEYLQVRDEHARLGRRREALNARLKELMIDGDEALIEVLEVGEEYIRPVPNDCLAVESQLLQALVSKAMWGRITTQVLDLQKYHAAKTTGQLKPEVIDAVEVTSTVWQLRVYPRHPKRT